ncbi:hypothetical protein V5O48_015161 [Marasmius crinis-equi]|uniref:Uncharacterized protein n=1 Tax=Marasmius crinis-equi TaxID=585013 RepID=A0ABR3EVB3_9AGAR
MLSSRIIHVAALIFIAFYLVDAAPAPATRPKTPLVGGMSPAAKGSAVGGKASAPKVPTAAGCKKKTDCKFCIPEGCEWDELNRKCSLPNTSKAPSNFLAKGSANQATPLCSKVQAAARNFRAAEQKLEAAAEAEFTSIQKHVIGNPKDPNPTSGRHLSQNFLKIQSNIRNYSRKDKPETGLSEFTRKAGNGDLVKHTWDNDPGHVHYSEQDVIKMGKEAIRFVLKRESVLKMDGLPETTVSVNPPRKNFNICLRIIPKRSLFPKSTVATLANPGDVC